MHNVSDCCVTVSLSSCFSALRPHVWLLPLSGPFTTYSFFASMRLRVVRTDDSARPATAAISLTSAHRLILIIARTIVVARFGVSRATAFWLTPTWLIVIPPSRSEEHTSELQS